MIILKQIHQFGTFSRSFFHFFSVVFEMALVFEVFRNPLKFLFPLLQSNLRHIMLFLFGVLKDIVFYNHSWLLCHDYSLCHGSRTKTLP